MKRCGKRTQKSGGALFPKLVDQAYREWVRRQPCLLSSLQCWGVIQVCHVKSRGSGGADHGNVVPMCVLHHDVQGRAGIKGFERTYRVDLRMAAAHYYEQYISETCFL